MDKNVTFPAPEEMRERLAEAMKRHDRTLSWLVRTAVTEWLNRDEKMGVRFPEE